MFDPPTPDFGHYSQLDSEGQVLFSKAIMAQAAEDDVVFEMMTEWTKERVELYQQAFYLYNVAREMRQMALADPETLLDQIFSEALDDKKEPEDDSDDKPFQFGI